MSVTQLLTAEDLYAMPDVPGKRFELVKGELVEVPTAAYPHAQLVRALQRLLDRFTVEHRLGEVFGDGLGYIIARDPDVVRVPDVSFIAGERLPDEGIQGFVPFAPDLAVEIVSPGDRAEEVYGKVREYLAAGTRLVWVFWPKYRAVSVHAPGEPTRELGPDDELDGGDLLPGFRASIAALFESAQSVP
jgi:Uma2 family endonuclease